jgi:dTDP-4-dehydrorhamnose 3,5-epimerase
MHRCNTHRHNVLGNAVFISNEPYVDNRGFNHIIYNGSYQPLLPLNEVSQIMDVSSNKNVIRGIHVSKKPKIITCVSGQISDIIVDLNPESPTFKKWISVKLTTHDQLYIPPYFGQGYYAFEDNTIINYLIGHSYGDEEFKIRWNDPQFGFDWPKNGNYILSDTDTNTEDFDEDYYLNWAKLDKP